MVIVGSRTPLIARTLCALGEDCGEILDRAKGVEHRLGHHQRSFTRGGDLRHAGTGGVFSLAPLDP
jgi:hypothetical protein